MPRHRSFLARELLGREPRDKLHCTRFACKCRLGTNFLTVLSAPLASPDVEIRAALRHSDELSRIRRR